MGVVASLSLGRSVIWAEGISPPRIEIPLQTFQERPDYQLDLTGTHLGGLTNFDASLSGVVYPIQNKKLNIGAGLGISDISNFSKLLAFPGIAIFGGFECEKLPLKGASAILPSMILVVVFEQDSPFFPQPTLKLDYTF